VLIDETKYIWSKWQQPAFTDNETWGVVSATSVHEVSGMDYSAFHALDENMDTHWESAEAITDACFIWHFEKPLKIYRIELVNKPTGNIHITKSVEVYADDGISGTNTKKREEFNRMIEDCMAGKIDMIITKSISRSARNTLDCLKYIRQLKDKNIPVFFSRRKTSCQKTFHKSRE